MKSRHMLRVTALLFLIAASAYIFLNPEPTQAASQDALLTGTVKSLQGEKMAGVTVSARLEGQTITTTVFTDGEGNYYFPPMEPGQYKVWAQADTFQTGHGDVSLSTVQHQDFTLKPMKDFIRQLTGDQLLASLPADTPNDRRLKRVFRNNCTSCHQPNYILQNRFDEQGWTAILNLMARMGVTGSYLGDDAAPAASIEYHKKELAAYLARARGPAPSTMKIRLRPRPTGDPARVVFTEYDVPLDPGNNPETKYLTNDGSDWSLGTPSTLNGDHGIHDAEADLNGNIWFTHNLASRDITIGRVDAKTGEVTYFKIPSPATGLAAGTHGMTRDLQGNIWFNVVYGGGVKGALGKVDPKTEKIEVFTTPKGMNGTAGTLDVDGKGKIWVTTDLGALRFDQDNQQFTEFKSPSYLSPDGLGTTYGLAADRQGNGWWEEMAIDTLGHSDVETGKVTEVKIPPVSGQKELITPDERKFYELAGSEWQDFVPWGEGPKRMGADKNGDFIYACDWWGGNIAKVNINTLKVTIIPMPRPDALQPYRATVDREHNVWVNVMNADEVLKLDPKTSQWTEYPFPTLGTETRYVSLLYMNDKLQVIFPYSRTRKVARMTFRTEEDMKVLRSQVLQGDKQKTSSYLQSSGE